MKSWNNQGNILFPWNCESVLKSHTHHPVKDQSPIEQKPNLPSSFNLIKTRKRKIIEPVEISYSNM